tara:strand:- start:6418 stop:6699 length:282 start_codon:yes stop_codon:yes gene_type:complete
MKIQDMFIIDGRYPLPYTIEKMSFFWYILATMSQDRLIRLVSKGDDGSKSGKGAGEVYYTRYNNKNKKDPSKKLTLKKYNKKLRKHVEFTQKK